MPSEHEIEAAKVAFGRAQDHRIKAALAAAEAVRKREGRDWNDLANALVDCVEARERFGVALASLLALLAEAKEELKVARDFIKPGRWGELSNDITKIDTILAKIEKALA